MSKLHVYMRPFLDDAGSAYVEDWEDHEVTDDVIDLGGLNEQLDNTEYDIGVFRSSNVKLKLNNDHGRYAEIGTLETVFKYRRGSTLVKITWEPGDGPLSLGFFRCDDPTAILSEEITVFEGLIDDLPTVSDIETQSVEFTVMGYESLLSSMATPFASLSIGDTIAEALEAILDQDPLNERVTVSGANISTGASVTIDAVASLEGKTALEAVKELLRISNSVLYLREGVLYVAPRTEGASLAFTFYGQGAVSGIENIHRIPKYRGGENRIINYVTWKDAPTLLAQDASSAAQFGIRKKEIGSDLITDNTKRTTLITSIKTEFANKKRELDLETALNPESLELFLLDKVSVDYPAPYLTSENENPAIYGIGEYGVDYYSDGVFPLTIEASARFKIMNRKVDFKREIITFGLREVA